MTTQTPQEQDEAFRRQMQDRASRQDPEAQRWVALDDQALDLGQEVDRGKRASAQVKDRAMDAMVSYERAVEERDDWLKDNPRPGMLNIKGRRDWDQARESHDTHVSAVEKQMLATARDASPEAIEAMQVQLGEQRAQLEKVLEERFQIAPMPSERSRAEQRGLVQQEVGPTHEAWQSAEQSSGKEGRQGEGNAQGGRRSWAESVDDRREIAQLEHAQKELEYQLGHRPTEKEIDAFLGNSAPGHSQRGPRKPGFQQR